MITKAILQSHPVSVLKKEIKKSNIKKYSKLTKGEIIELMLKDENKGKFEEEDRKKAAKLPERKGPKKAAKVTTFGPAKPPRGIKRGGKKAKKESEPKIDPLHQVSKEDAKKSKPVKSKAFKEVVKELDEKGKVYRKARKEFGKDDPLRSKGKKRKPRKPTTKGRISAEDKLEKAYEKAMAKTPFDKDTHEKKLNEGYAALKKKYKK